MTHERDDLAEMIARWFDDDERHYFCGSATGTHVLVWEPYGESGSVMFDAADVADAIIAAGWRPGAYDAPTDTQRGRHDDSTGSSVTDAPATPDGP